VWLQTVDDAIEAGFTAATRRTPPNPPV